jgi:cytochrome c biogenesis protein CcmG/thiol:disulfide interchange protein DsbE
MFERLPKGPLLLVVIAVVGAIWSTQVRMSRDAEQAQRLRLEQATGARWLDAPAPDVTLYDRGGRGVPLAQYRGRVVLVNFWATWCGPCVAEMPSLVALAGRLDPADIAFVSIAEDDSWPPVHAWLQRNPLPFDLYRDQPPRVEIQFETGSYPTTFLIDRDGRARYRFDGARDWDTPEVVELLALEGVRAVR